MPSSSLEPSTAPAPGRVPHATPDAASAPELAALSAFLSQVRAALRMEVAFVGRFDGDVRRLVLVDDTRDLPRPLQAGDADPVADTYCHLVARGQLEEVVRDTAGCAATAGLPITARFGIGCYLSAPIVLADGTVWGTVCCFSTHPRPELRDEDARVLRSIASLVAGAVGADGVLRGPVWPGAPVPPAP